MPFKHLLPIILISGFISASIQEKEAILREVKVLEKGLEKYLSEKEELDYIGEQLKQLDPEIDREEFEQVATKLRKFLETRPTNIHELLKRSEELRIRAQENNLQEEDVCHVSYNPTQNSIVAFSHRNSEDYNSSLTITVIKYLDDGHFEIHAHKNQKDDHGMFWFIHAQANPIIVTKLKNKITEFEQSLIPRI